jgi:hypothetical protein
MYCWSFRGYFFFSSVFIPNSAHFTFSDFFNILSISDSDIKQEIRHLSPSKCVGPDEIPNIIKGCPEIFAPISSHIFNINLLQGKFPTLWKQTTVVPVSKKGNNALVTNYRPITILNNFSKIFDHVIHDQLSFYFKFKLHPSQHGSIKSESTATSLLT